MNWSLILVLLVTGLILWWAWRNRKVVAVCGHKTRPWTMLDSGEESRSLWIPTDVHGRPQCCHACLAKMTIRCVSCGRPIFVGDGVTLSLPLVGRPAGSLPLFAATPYRPEGDRPDPDGRYLGCVRPTCLAPGMSALGTWVIPGRLEWNDNADWPNCFVGVGE